MAWWAFWTTVISAISVGVTGVGIYYVRKTLKANSEAVDQEIEANNIARDNSHRELRAYLSTTYVTVERDSADSERYVMNLGIANHGQAPATVSNVLFIALWHWVDGGTEVIDVRRDVRLKCHRELALNLPFGFDGGFNGCEKPGIFFVNTWLTYTDVFGKENTEHFGWTMSPANRAEFYLVKFPVSMDACPPEALAAQITEQQKARAGITN